MIDLSFIDVTAAVVGQKFALDWTNARIVPTLRQQEVGITDTIGIYNESGCGFKVQFNQSGRTFTLPAGGWAPRLEVGLPGAEDWSLTLIVQYVLPNAAVSQVHADYFSPGEATSGNSVVLGNSPVNIGSGIVTASNTSIVNTGNPPGTPIITSSSTAVNSGGFAENNDGSGQRTILDAGVTSNVENVVAGTGVAHAAVTIGDAGDLAMTNINAGQVHVNAVTTETAVNAGPVISSTGYALLDTGAGAGARLSTPLVGASALYLFFRSWDGAAGHRMLGLGTQSLTAGLDPTVINDSGVIAKVAGQATAGSFGVPTIIAQVISQHITTTGVITLINITAPATGVYRISGAVTQNGTVGATTQFWCTFTDANVGALGGQINLATITNLNGIVVADGSHALGTNPLGILSTSFAALGGQAIQVKYQNATATPSDWVSALLERLA